MMLTLTNGIKIGSATVVVDIIPKGNPEIRPAKSMKPKKITTHNTGNDGRGANAKAHNTYIHNMAKLQPKDTSHVSWHISVDDKYIYQHIPFNETAWHCGDGAGINSGNSISIGIEICENPETNTKQAEENAIALSILLLKQFKLTPSDVVPHQHWSGKYCPRVILKRDGSFKPYRNRVETAYKSLIVTQQKKEEEELFNSGSSTINKEVVATIVAARKAGILKSDTYVDKAKNGTLTLQELTAINTLIMKRSYLDTQENK